MDQETRSQLISSTVKLGGKSSKYKFAFDLREFFYGAHEEAVRRVAAELWAQMRNEGIEILVGKGVGGGPLLSAIKRAAFLDGHELQALYVRDSRKDHGFRKIVEGPTPSQVRPGAIAVFIDDLLNTGSTYRKARDTVMVEGFSLRFVGVACLVNFWNGSRALVATGSKVFEAVRRHELGLTRKDPLHSLVSTPKPLWHFATLHTSNRLPIKGPPSLVGDRVFVPGDDTHLYCLDVHTGDLLWKLESSSPQPKGSCSAVRFDGTHIYWSSYDGTVRKAVPETGELIWSTKVDLNLHSSPCFNDDMTRLFVGTEFDKHAICGLWYGKGDIVCLETRTGRPLWRVPTQGMVPGSPAYAAKHDLVVCGSNDFNTYVIDASSGELRFKLKNKGEVKCWPAFTADGDNVVTVSIQGWCQCYSLLSGQMLWERKVGDASFHPYPYMDGSSVIVTNDAGHVVCLDVGTGRVLWLCTLRGGIGWGVIRLGDRAVLAVTETGYCAALDKRTGAKISAFKLPAGNPAFKGVTLWQPAAVHGNTMIVATNNRGVAAFELNPIEGNGHG